MAGDGDDMAVHYVGSPERRTYGQLHGTGVQCTAGEFDSPTVHKPLGWSKQK